MRGHQFGADARTGDIQHGVGQAGQLPGDIRERGHAQNVAQGDAQDLAPAETRQLDGGGHPQVVLTEKLEQPFLVAFHGQHAVEASRIGDFEDGLRPLHGRFGKKPAIREQVHRALQRRRRVDDLQ